MLTPFILFLGLTVATAVIAYWSDNLGKKLGKKRVSLFGLRPRTTATVLTITSSWAIMLFTLAVLLIVVTPLRRALFRYDSDRAKYRQDISRAEGRLTEVRERLDDAQNSVKNTQDKLAKTQSSLKQARYEVESARQEGEKAKARAAEAQAGEKKALAGVANAQRRAAAAQRRYASAQSQFLSAQEQLRGAEQRLNAARQREVDARRGESEARRSTLLANRELSAARNNLKATRNNLKVAQQDVKKANLDLTKANAAIVNANRTLDTASRLVNEAGKEVLALDVQKAELLRELDRYQQVTEQLGGVNISIPVGRTFAAGIIESGKSQKRIEENLRQLLAKGREALPTLGVPDNSTLELLPLPDVVNGEVRFLQGNAIFERLAREIASSEEPTSVRLIAVRNFVLGETKFDARFVAVKVATAFRSGEVLATIDVDGTGGDASIFNKLQVLTDEGREVAAERKVNPPQSPQEPFFFASGTNVALFAALRRIEATKKTVRVRLVAADDLSTVEPLRVRFEIEGENKPVALASGG